jgi:hypothetical protein
MPTSRCLRLLQLAMMLSMIYAQKNAIFNADDVSIIKTGFISYFRSRSLTSPLILCKNVCKQASLASITI